MKRWLSFIMLLWISVLCQGTAAASELTMLQDQWARITYEYAPDAREEGLESLAEQARELTAQDPDNADLLIWKGIIVSSLAGERGGLGALKLAKEARDALERALAINEQALSGSAHTSLGILLHRVPGWPIGFGSDRKARAHLEQALTMNPDGIDPHFFMAQLLADKGEYAPARQHLEAALQAPDRPGRNLADQGRREEIRHLLNEIGERGQ